MPSEEEKKDKIEQEKKIFILSSTAMIEALKNDQTLSRRALRQGGPMVQQRVLIAAERLKVWIRDEQLNAL